MKRSTIIAILSFIGIILLTSCRRDNLGWPTKVSFEKDGGEKIVEPEYVDGDVYHLDILDYDEPSENNLPSVINVDFKRNDSETDDSELETTFQYKWLTISVTKRHFRSMKLKAEPNATGQPRKLGLSGMIMNSHFVMDVEQKG